MLHITILTLFPEMFPGPLGVSRLGEGLAKGLWHLSVIALRDFGVGRYQAVDDTAFGGGPGMVIRADVLEQALEQALNQVPKASSPRILYPSPRGVQATQRHFKMWSDTPDRPLIFLCGRYEGIDQRVIDHYNIEEISLGDFILMGGEIAAMAMIEGCVRLSPGILGNPASLEDESFSQYLLEYPHYTKPREWNERQVPEVLLSGHHEAIRSWRKKQAENITQKRRPDLWTSYQKRGMKGDLM